MFEQLSSSIGWEIITEQNQSHYSGFAVLKGCTKYAGFICKKAEKYEEQMMRKLANVQKKQVA